MSKDIHIINDPIHGAMEFNEEEKNWIKPIIDHPVFQRLRRIKQLGFADFIFPGAVHTRFNHCIGTCYLAKKVMAKLESIISIEEKEYKDIKRKAMVAALLHDIGHGPFSHGFEKLFDNDSKSEGKAITHEGWSRSFILELAKDPEINNGEQKFIENIGSIVDLIEGKRSSASKNLPLFVFDIISSQLDVDRLDYLLRDSHFSGTAYGKYSPDWLIHCLDLGFKHEDIKVRRLGIIRKGIGVIEHYLMARRLMTLYVYLHKKKCALEFLFKRLLELAVEESLELEKEIKIDENLKNFLKNTNEYQKGNCKNEEFIKNNFEYYKNLIDDTLWDFITKISEQKCKKDKDIFKIASRIKNRHLPEVKIIDSSKYEIAKLLIEDFLSKNTHIKKWQVYLDKPKFQTYKSIDKEIFIIDGENSISIRNESKIIALATDQPETPSYLYIDKEVKEQTEEPLVKKLENGVQAILPNQTL